MYYTNCKVGVITVEKIIGINKKVILVSSVLLLILLLGGTYAWLQLVIVGKKVNTITANTLKMTLEDNASDGISIVNAVPTTDETGKKGEVYKFILENTGDIGSDYTVFLESQLLDKLEGNFKHMPQNRIKYNLKKSKKIKSGEDRNSDTDTIINTDNSDNTDILTPNYLRTNDNELIKGRIDSGSLEPKQYVEYELVLWIDQDATYEELKDTAYIGKIKLEASQQGIE